jgi:DNA-binding NtrC family response regulator
MTDTLLLIGKDGDSLETLARDLQGLGYQPILAGDGLSAQRELSAQTPDLIVFNHPWPRDLGPDLLAAWMAEYPCLILCDEAHLEAALAALRLGAAEILVRPIDQGELVMAVRRIIDHALLYRQGEFYTHLIRAEAPSLLIGDSEAMRQLRDLIRAVAPSEATVLILGESGVGKEKVAQEIHHLSPRAAGPLVAVDTCSLPATLFEAELFGFERGAFTGASHRKAGLIEEARWGTLFLDEIGEISATLQAKLLRVLETRRYRRLGGTRDLTAEVRILAATNRDLEAMIRTGEFRQDLFFRLSTFPIRVPPLRDRRGDIPALVRYFLAQAGASRGIAKRVSTVAMSQLLEHDWPGNIRELRNAVERASILSGSRLRIDVEDFTLGRPPPPREPSPSATTGESPNRGGAGVTLSFNHEPTLAEVEQLYLRLLLSRQRRSRAELARVLGIGERTLYRLLADRREEVDP